MKRQLSSSSPPSSPRSNSPIDDELEPVAKRPRFYVPTPTPPPDENNEIIDEREQVEEGNNDDYDFSSIDDDNEDEIIVDEPLNFSDTFSEESRIGSTNDANDDDDEIIEIEQIDHGVIFVSDSDSDSDDSNDDQGIDVTDEIPPSVSSIVDTSIFSPDNEDIEIVHEIIDEDLFDEGDESLEIVANDVGNELIDLTDDEPIPISHSPSSVERKLSTDVQQCPICLETLSDLQRTGVYLIITRCRHVMCTLCSRQLLTTSSRCPLCRENVSATSLMPYCILT